MQPGDTLLLYSDGLVEAHNTQRAMLGFPQLRSLTEGHAGGAALIPFLMDQLAAFTGPNWEQEDDVTLLTVQRLAAAPTQQAAAPGWRILGEFDLPSAPGNERLAIEQVMQWQQSSAHGQASDRLKTAVGEATMNAMEHGNRYQADLPVHIAVLATDGLLQVRIVDHGGDRTVPTPHAAHLDAKLAGLQLPLAGESF